MKAKRARTKWVDFKALKEKVGMIDILKHYELLNDLQPKKDGELTGYCPIHDESRYNKDSFCVNVEKNIWNCFACGAHGNILDFVSEMEDVDIREAGLLIQKWFDLAPAEKLARKGRKPERKPELTDEKPEPGPEAEPETPAPEKQPPGSDISRVNPPLTFELKNLDQEHPYLKERGLKPETIKEFGIGFCTRGLMKDRIAIPIHNENGELIAYAGRWPGEPTEGEPKYKLPRKFQKHCVLYNFHRAKDLAKGQGLILTEGFFDVMKLWQAGIKNVVALMGTVLSDEQEQLLVNALAPDGKLTLMLDPDEPGQKAAKEITARLITMLYIKVIDLKDEGLEPDRLSEEKIKALLK